MGISCYVLTLKFSGLGSRGPTDLWSTHCVLYAAEKGGTKMQRLGAALLSAQGVPPIICWNCCEKPRAPNWDTRSHSGQVVLSSSGPTHSSMKTGIIQSFEGCWCFTQIPAPHPFCDVLILKWSHPVPFPGRMPSASGTAQVLLWVSVKRAGCWSPTGSQAESVKQLISVSFPVRLPSLTPHLSLCFFSPHPSRIIYLTSLGVEDIQCFVLSGKRDVSRAEFWTLHRSKINEGKCSPLPTNFRL